MAVEGIIFDIARFCTNDGPGIRTTVFLKGCPLRCVWCHNPESHNIYPEIMFKADDCLFCGRCVVACQIGCHRIYKGDHGIDRGKCTACGRCVDVCGGALRIAGSKTTADEVINEVIKDKVYYKTSKGGLTISGGEPLFQADFTADVLRRAKQAGIHTCIETSGYAEPDKLFKVMPYTDLFLFDQKESDSQKHREYTGVGNELIYKNLDAIDQAGIPVVLTCPLIPGLNDTEENLKGIADRANRLNCVRQIRIRPYHTLGCAKYTQLGRVAKTSDISAPTKGNLGICRDILKNMTDKEIVMD